MVGIVFISYFFVPMAPDVPVWYIEGCKEPDQHQLVYGVSAIKGRKVVEKMCLRPGLTHSAKALWFFPQIREQMSGPEIS